MPLANGTILAGKQTNNLFPNLSAAQNIGSIHWFKYFDNKLFSLGRQGVVGCTFSVLLFLKFTSSGERQKCEEEHSLPDKVI